MLDVDDTVARHLGAHGDGRSKGVELEVGHCMGVGGQNHLAAGFNREAGEVRIQILAARKTVDLDRNTGVGTGREYLLPPCLEARPMVEVTPARVGEDMDLRRAGGPYETFGLITVGVEVTVDRGHDAVDLETLSLRHVEGAVLQDLDLEALEQVMVLTPLAVPPFDPPPLQADPFPVEAGRDLEAARVIGHHRPGVAAPDTRTSHGLERRLAVRVAGVPVAGAAQSLRVEICLSRSKYLAHLSATQVPLPSGPTAACFAALKSLYCGVEGIGAPTRQELLDQWLEPAWLVGQQISTRSRRTVKNRIAGAQKRQPPVPGRFRFGEAEQRLGQQPVRDRSRAHHKV